MYRVLARKYRPQTFADLVGQEVLVKTLANAFLLDRVSQGYIFTGVRGVGKTTTARIIAKALNCIGADGTVTKPTADPCGVCRHCVAISEDRHMDVLELDAASRTGVADMREIIEQVRYAPVEARRKVYIIDEVHMLSGAAFNALLKTLEEPPPQVTFLFATTDIHKVPVTILSRCQRFDLARLSVDALAAHLTDICAREGGTLEPDAALILARAGEGSVRDGLSLLDQALALGGGELLVTAPLVHSMLGRSDALAPYQLLKAALSGQVAEALRLLEQFHQHGSEPLLLLQDMLGAVHRVSRFRAAPTVTDMRGLADAERQALEALAAAHSIPVLTRAWQILLHGYEEARLCEQSLPAVEMILIRLCYVGDMPTPDELVRGVRGEASGTRNAPALDAKKSPAETVSTAAANPIQHHASPLTPQTSLSFNDIIALAETQKEGSLAYHLRHSVVVKRCDKQILDIALRRSAPSTLPGQLSQFLQQHTGMRWTVGVVEDTGDAPTLADTERSARSAAEAEILADPLVVEALQLFPGSAIEKVTLKPVAVKTADTAQEPSLLADKA
ncbi:MAG: DNA polymerase III subunit gamma/tau [Thalassospira sp.]|nr:DNA polymerase III subunit gamma/tau [Thalassospira sp.]